jgi:hypothetical protein
MSGTQYAYSPTQAVDVVAVFDSNFNQLFSDARPMTADVKEEAKLMKHPVESGATYVDFRVIEPIKIDLHMTLRATDYVNTYQQIKQVFLAGNTVTVQTNTGPYLNMLLGKMPHKENPNVFDTIKITLSFEEIQLFSLGGTSALPPSLTTKAGGNVTGQTATQTQENAAIAQTQQSSAAYSIFYGNGSQLK